ncbi:hypothetical protein QYE76_053458 [Lolium multiflorum]|uniref:Uncharacterized protein n=1 Tax=Lolium multiflorum TaxID=4521 RepID=A0AAD8SWE8_LOLMU|nr:hypothetical protein QYE76_053458 [Lolium multiflorum]
MVKSDVYPAGHRDAADAHGKDVAAGARRLAVEAALEDGGNALAMVPLADAAGGPGGRGPPRILPAQLITHGKKPDLTIRGLVEIASWVERTGRRGNEGEDQTSTRFPNPHAQTVAARRSSPGAAAARRRRRCPSRRSPAQPRRRTAAVRRDHRPSVAGRRSERRAPPARP